MEHGFAEGVQRAKGRYDILYGFDGNEEFMEVDATLHPVLSQIFQSERLLLFNGLLHSQPGSNEQLWHADGEHLFPGTSHSYLPVHSLNVFVPLVDITEDNGGTEFFLGSHRLTGESENIVWQDSAHKERIGCTGDPIAFTCRAGSVIIFDYRILHRGLANTSRAARPVLYFTYARAWFRDMHNFPSRSLLDVISESHLRRAGGAGRSAASATHRVAQTRRSLHSKAFSSTSMAAIGCAAGVAAARSAWDAVVVLQARASHLLRAQRPKTPRSLYPCVFGGSGALGRGVGILAKRPTPARSRVICAKPASLRRSQAKVAAQVEMGDKILKPRHEAGAAASAGQQQHTGFRCATSGAGKGRGLCSRPAGAVDHSGMTQEQVEEIRREFPAVHKLAAEGEGVVLCDGAGGSQMHQSVFGVSCLRLCACVREACFG